MNSKNLNRNVKAMILLIGLSSILFSNSVTAQSKFSSSGSGNAHLFEVSNNSHWVGLGAHPTDIDFSYFTPSAAFHIRLDSSDFPLYPLFKIDINQSLTDYGTLSFIFSYERHKLGIFQKGQDVSNIFEGLTFVGVYSSLFNSSKNGGFKFVTDGKGFFNDTLSLKRPLYFYHNENHQSGITWESTDPDDVFSFTNTDVRSNTIWYPLTQIFTSIIDRISLFGFSKMLNVMN